MIKKFRDKNSFLFNVITLVSGTAASQGILLVATPFLTRFYSPDEFGVFALYVAIVGIISVVASWKYEMAILLPKDESDAQALLFLSIIITFITALSVFLFILIFNDLLVRHTINFALFRWLVPVGVLVTGLLQVFTAWSTRREYFNDISTSRIALSGTTVLGQLSLKTTKLFSPGLIWGHLFGTLISLVVLVTIFIKKQSINLRSLQKNKIISNMHSYSNFPKYQSFAVLINSLSQNLPVLLLTLFYQPAIAGFYSLTHRALSTPIRLIGGSVRQVFYQNAAKTYSKNKSIKDKFLKTTLNLGKISIIPYLVLAIFGPTIFKFIFGNEWLISGIYAQLLILFFFLMTINPPAVVAIQILGLQKLNLIYEILLALFSFAAIYIGFVKFNSHYYSIGMFSIVGVIFNAWLIYYIYLRISKLNVEIK
ncbi:lipopolysaccharide biosynthesis protein [Candidatus Neomarinimicrobiota bacterium]